MIARLALSGLLCASAATADTVVAAHTIRANTIITAQDLLTKGGDTPGAATDPAQLIGSEARVALYAGRPISPAHVGPPAVVERNQIVPLIYHQNGLKISAEGRSLSRAGSGDLIRVMNLSSRTTVSGRVMPDGQVLVSK